MGWKVLGATGGLGARACFWYFAYIFKIYFIIALKNHCVSNDSKFDSYASVGYSSDSSSDSDFVL